MTEDKIYTIEEIGKKNLELLQNEPVKRVILFGSYAKKISTEKSDIDLVISSCL